MLYLITSCLILCLAACAPMTERERDIRYDRHTVDSENWKMCEEIYALNNAPTYHIGHSHSRLARNRPPRPHEVKSDLHTNHCKFIMDKYWVDYPSKDEY